MRVNVECANCAHDGSDHGPDDRCDALIYEKNVHGSRCSCDVFETAEQVEDRLLASALRKLLGGSTYVDLKDKPDDKGRYDWLVDGTGSGYLTEQERDAVVRVLDAVVSA